MIGRNVGHYVIEEKLGEGGMGVVYRARDTRLHRHVALKFPPEDAVSTPADRERILAEARAAAALDHPNICTVHEVGDDDGRLYIVMAYVEGRSLREVIDAEGPLPLDRALDIALQVARGLQAAHRRGIVHRDVKSANVMITSDGRALVMDFGLAARSDDGVGGSATSGTTVGTVAYAAPEQLRGEAVDARADVWSFGVMLFEMLTGSFPFRGDYPSALTYAILNERPHRLQELRPEAPDALDALVARLLTPSLDERPSDMDAVLAELEPIAALCGAPSAAGAGGRRAGPKRTALTTALVWAGVVLAVDRLAGAVSGRWLLGPQVSRVAVAAFAALFPALLLFMLARTGSVRWRRIARAGVPVALVFAIGLVGVMVHGADLGTAGRRVTVTTDTGESLVRVVPTARYRRRVVMFPFRDATGDTAVAWLAHGLPLLVQNDLLQDPFVTLTWPTSSEALRVREAAGFRSWKGVPVALMRDVARRMAAQYFLTGDLRRGTGAGKAQADVSLYATDTGRPVFQQSLALDDPLGEVDALSVALRRAMEVPDWHIEQAPDAPVAEITSSNLEALRAYVAGVRNRYFDLDYDAARRQFALAVGLDSTFAGAWYELYSVLGESGATGQSEQKRAMAMCLRHGYRLPERIRFIVRANAAFTERNPEQASAVVRMMTELYPDDPMAWQAEEQVARMRNEPQRRLRAVRHIVELDPTAVHYMGMLASLYASRGQYDSARVWYEHWAGARPRDVDPLLGLARLERTLGQRDAASEAYERAALLDPDDVSIAVAQADLARERERYVEAARILDDAMRHAKTARDTVGVLSARESLELTRGRVRAAIEIGRRRLRVSARWAAFSDQVYARMNLAAYDVLIGRTERALRGVREAARRLPPALAGLDAFPRLSIWVEAGRADSIGRDLEVAETFVARYHYEAMRPFLRLARAMWLEANGDAEAADGEYASVLERQPDHVDALRRRAACARRAGDARRAVEWLERARRINPSDGRIRLELARALDAAGKGEAARRELAGVLHTWADADSDYVYARRARELARRWGVDASERGADARASAGDPAGRR